MIEDFSLEVLFSIGERVEVKLFSDLEHERLFGMPINELEINHYGTIIGAYIKFAKTPNMRKIIFIVRMDYDKNYIGSIGPILHVTQKQLFHITNR